MGHILVTVDDAHADRVDEVARSLRAAGMRIDDIFDVVIAGEADDARALASVDGVSAVEPATGFQLPPPDADVQ